MSQSPEVPPVSDSDRPHKPADDNEEIYFHGSPLMRGELRRLLVCWTIGILIAAAPFVYQGMQPDGPFAIVLFVCWILAAIFFLVPWAMAHTVRYRISNYRIDYERGLLSKRIDTMELWHVEDVTFYQSVTDRILNVGDITVLSHDETTPKLVLEGLPNPRPLFDSLKQRIIAVKRQRGVIKMDVG